MKASANKYLDEPRVISGTAYSLARFGLLVLVPLLAFCLPRWLGYDIPNLSEPWQPAIGGASNALAFLGAPIGEGGRLYGVIISTADGLLIYDGTDGPRRHIEAVPIENQKALARRQGWRPLIPYTFVRPPGEVVDYYKGSWWAGSPLCPIPIYYVILSDGTMWEWVPVRDDNGLGIMQIVGGIYALITLLTVLVLLRLGRLWTGTWFWQTAVHSQPELARRTLLTAVASLIPGIALIELFSLFEPYQAQLIIMALVVAIMTAPCVIFIRRKTIAVFVSVFIGIAAVLWLDGGFYEWQLWLYFYALLTGLLTSLAVLGLVNFFHYTTLAVERDNISGG